MVMKEIIVINVINIIKEDLKSVGIQHDIWVHESSILNKVPLALKVLEEKDLVYKGKLGNILSKKGQESGQELLLFKSSKFSDSFSIVSILRIGSDFSCEIVRITLSILPII